MKNTKYLLLLLVIYIFSIVRSIEINKNPNNKDSVNDNENKSNSNNNKNINNNNNNNNNINNNNNDFKKIQVGKNGLNETLFWGTYKPHQYFGLKTRSIEPINTGLIWSTPNIKGGFRRINYKVGGNGVGSYTWLKHDGKNFGIQDIYDAGGNLNLTTSFVKKSGKNGGDWSIRISGKSNETQLNNQPLASLIYFIHDESIKDSPKQLDFLSIQNLQKEDDTQKISKNGISGDLQIKGKHKDIGRYTLYFSDVSDKEKQQKTLEKYDLVDKQPDISGWRYYGISDHSDNNWDIVTKIFDNVTNLHLKESGQNWMKNQRKVLVPTLANKINKKSNIVAIQRVLTVPFDLEITFVADEYHGKELSENEIQEIVKSTFTGKNYEQLLNQYENQFDEKFNTKFNYEKLRKHPNYFLKVTKESLSSLIGGFGYWYGRTIYEKDGKTLKTNPVALYSATPSRTAFPRGFLWDEGFHQLLVSTFDIDLTIESLSHWFNIMNKKGWIPREQILGREAMSMVPEEFIKQSPIVANPPALILSINKLIETAETLKKSGHQDDYNKIYEFLKEAYPRIQIFYKYYWTTQSSGKLDNAFRWRDRKINHTLASGLDDYPRAYTPSEMEIHLDLNSWVAFFAQSLSKYSEFLDYKEESIKYENQFKDILKVIEDYHWDAEDSLFHDILLYPNGTKEFIKTHGYLNYFPFFLGLLPENSPKIPLLITTLKDVNGIWSRWGIRSLSLKDKHFGTNENYWRGPIWLPINYLFTQSMYKKYMKTSISISDLYVCLRFNLISNIGKKYIETGYFYEQYDPINGDPLKNHPFTGWTALVASIITEQY